MRILKVIDTRQYEEGPNDRWFPISGSGDEHECGRCGRFHEIHYHVETEPGQVSIVGGGCALKDGLIADSLHKSSQSAATTLARLQSQLDASLRRDADYETASRLVDAMPVPDLVEVPSWLKSVPESKAWKCGDGLAVLCRNGILDEERRSCAVRGWKDLRLAAIFGTQYYHSKTADLRSRIARCQKRLSRMLQPSSL